jgi:hypothetical protein
MTQFEILKLVTDFGLVGSLLYFAYRFLHNQAPVDTYQLQELQNGLRGAIREADQAGKGLNEQLLQRKQSLEKLLLELESVENRITRVINSAEERKGDLEFEINKAKQLKTEINKNINAPKKDLLSADMAEFSEAVNPTTTTNIFGEPIGETAAVKNIEKAFSNTPLTVKIEKQVEIVAPPPKPQKTPVLTLEEVYAEAEDMLRAGRAVEEVSKQTHLTSDEVRMLSQMVESDAVEVETSSHIGSGDNRLGVLAGFKRQTEIL